MKDWVKISFKFLKQLIVKIGVFRAVMRRGVGHCQHVPKVKKR